MPQQPHCSLNTGLVAGYRWKNCQVSWGSCFGSSRSYHRWRGPDMACFWYCPFPTFFYWSGFFFEIFCFGNVRINNSNAFFRRRILSVFDEIGFSLFVSCPVGGVHQLWCQSCVFGCRGCVTAGSGRQGAYRSFSVSPEARSVLFPLNTLSLSSLIGDALYFFGGKTRMKEMNTMSKFEFPKVCSAELAERDSSCSILCPPGALFFLFPWHGQLSSISTVFGLFWMVFCSKGCYFSLFLFSLFQAHTSRTVVAWTARYGLFSLCATVVNLFFFLVTWFRFLLVQFWAQRRLFHCSRYYLYFSTLLLSATCPH